ncbi:MAG: FAD-binding protein, partial [Candidatus Eisenbacteria bacterium]
MSEPLGRPAVSGGRRGRPTLSAAARARASLGDEAVIAEPDRLLPYATDALPLHRRMPALLLRPRDAAAVVQAVKMLHDTGLPWAARGAGTGVSGGAVPPAGGAVLSLARLRRIVRIDVEARRARVESGVVNRALEDRLAPLGLAFAPDPASRMAATIGGNVATNAAGPRALALGSTSRHVLGLRIVLGDGTVLELGGDEETMAGYDLLGCFMGSEGTLAVATEATLRLIRRPAARASWLASFDTVADACRALAVLQSRGLQPAALEMLTGAATGALVDDLGAESPRGGAGSVILLGAITGRLASVAARIGEARGIMRAEGARAVWPARDAVGGRETPRLQDEAGGRGSRSLQDEVDEERLWTVWEKLPGGLGRLAPDQIAQTAAMARAALPGVLTALEAIAERHGVRMANFVHAGTRLRAVILYDARDAEQSRRTQEAAAEIARLALDAGGVLTGEQGIGLARREMLRLVCSPYELELMDRVRRIFDPWGLVNPGKLLPDLDGGDARVAVGASADDIEEGVTAPARPARRDVLAPPALLQGPARLMTPQEGELAAALRASAEAWEPVVPIGGGTLMACGDCGRPLSTEALAEVRDYDPEEMTITVDAGVHLAEIESRLAEHRQTLAWECPDPSRATIGGVIAAGYWGSLAGAHGHPKHSVRGLRALTGQGELIVCGGRHARHPAGYDLARLLIGSRGTLAVISRITLETYPQAPYRAVAMVRGAWSDLAALAGRLAGGDWTVLDLLADGEQTMLMIGCEGRTRNEIQDLDDAIRGAGATIERFEQEETRQAREWMAQWLAWSEAPIIVRLVVSPGTALDVAGRVQALCFPGRGEHETGEVRRNARASHPADSRAWSCRLQVHPGAGLIRVAFM